MTANSSIFTLAIFQVSSENQSAFIKAWQALCSAFLHLPQPPATNMTLIQSTENLEVFQSLGAWHKLEDVEAMRTNLEIMPLMNAMVALTEHAQPGTFNIIGTIPNL